MKFEKGLRMRPPSEAFIRLLEHSEDYEKWTEEKDDKLRDHLDPIERLMIALGEALAAERIEALGCMGVDECAEASRACSEFVGQAVHAEWDDRQKILSNRQAQ